MTATELMRLAGSAESIRLAGSAESIRLAGSAELISLMAPAYRVPETSRPMISFMISVVPP